MPNNKLEKLKKLLEITNEGLTREDFLVSFKQVIDQVLKIETKALEKVNLVIKEIRIANNASLQAIQADLRGFQEDIKQSTAKALKEQENGLNFIKDKVKTIMQGKQGEKGQDGINGKDADPIDESKIISEVMNKIKIPEVDKDMLEIKEELERIKTQRTMFGAGGGTSYLGIKQHFVNDETPSGTLNGTNTDFTLASAPNPTNSLKVYRNGQRLKLTEDYTLSGITITFVIAPESDEILTVDYMK